MATGARRAAARGGGKDKAMAAVASTESMSDRARRAVGPQGEGDWRLRPDEHAARLPPEAGALQRVLMQPSIQDVIAGYHTFDAQALLWQGRYLRWGKRGIWTGAAAVVPALLLTVAPISMPPILNVLASVLVWILLCIAWGCFLYLVLRRPNERWYGARANAEELRKRMFEAVLARDEPVRSNEIALLPLQLEYFRRYQYEVQKDFFLSSSTNAGRRARIAEIAHGIAGLAPLAALGLTIAIALSAGSEQGLIHSALTWLGGRVQWIENWSFDTLGIGLAIFFSALSAALFAVAQLDNYRRHSQRYRSALRRIEEIANDPRIGLQRARDAAVDGDRRTVERLVREMHAVMSAELSEWVTLGLDEKVIDMPTFSRMADRPFKLESGPDDATDLVASGKLTPAAFETIRSMVRARLVTARRIGFVAARQATRDEPVETRWNGKEANDVARPGDWIVTNMSADRAILRDRAGSVNTYVIRRDTFVRLYDRDTGETEYGAIYKSKSVVEAFLLPGSFEILAPWGEIQRGARGYLVKNGDEIYGNNRETFEATYEVVDGQSR